MIHKFLKYGYRKKALQKNGMQYYRLTNFMFFKNLNEKLEIYRKVLKK